MNMLLDGFKVGFALTGSFCTFSKVMPVLESIVREGADVIPIISPAVDQFDTRFGTAESWKLKIREITGKDIWTTIPEVEPIGPKALLDVLVVAPCTGKPAVGQKLDSITCQSVLTSCCVYLTFRRSDGVFPVWRLKVALKLAVLLKPDSIATRVILSLVSFSRRIAWLIRS